MKIITKEVTLPPPQVVIATWNRGSVMPELLSSSNEVEYVIDNGVYKLSGVDVLRCSVNGHPSLEATFHLVRVVK